MPSKINYLLGIFLSILVLISHKPAFAINNPNLLPEEKTPVIDLAKTLSPNQKKSLEDKLNNLEIESGWKIKYLSQFESSPGSAVKRVLVSIFSRHGCENKGDARGEEAGKEGESRRV